MLRNYLTIALRNLRRNRGYTVINLVGLAVGLAACLLIGLYVRHELSYDDFHENADRIYRVVQPTERGESSRGSPPLMHSARLGPAIDANFPSVQQAVRISHRWGREVLVERREHTFYEDAFFFADAAVFEIFNFALRQGNPETALMDPFSVVLTESTAERYFGDTNPMGKTIRAKGYNRTHELTVTGVVENPPSNSHIQFDFLTSFNTLRQSVPGPKYLDSWRYTAHYTYILLENGAEPTELEGRLSQFIREQQDQSSEDSEKRALLRYELQPITAIHLYSQYDQELAANSDIRYVYLFATLALLILVLACVNYVNLATAQAQHRARGVGVRKTVGAGRGQLIRQYLGESALLCGTALIAALILARLALPAFNDLAGTQLGAQLFDPATLLLLLGLGTVVALLAGAYPAFYLSSFRPAQVIEGRTSGGSGRGRLRKGLVVVQFAVAVGLIAGTILIHQQLRHMQTKQLGLNEERVVVVHARNALYRTYEAFKQELLRQSSITGVTASSVALPTTQNLDVDLVPEGNTRTQWIGSGSPPTNRMGIDADFEEVLGIPLVTGRGLSAGSDSADVIPALINETAAQAFGWEDPVGKTLPCCSQSPYRVVGVIQDFHYQTLRQQIQPLVLASGAPRYVLARVQSGEVSTALGAIRTEWQEVSDAPFEYSVLDQSFDQTYRAERRMASVFLAFAGLAIGIACLGLLGLAAYAAKRREKEIGIRKTLGATARDVVALLSKEFLLLVGIACLIAVPVAYLGVSRWLRDFAYRVEIRPWVFVGAGLLAAAIALATISVQALRAARIDPARTLREE